MVCLRVFSFVESGVDFMKRALEIADQALGRTSPNPAVGAVVVKDGLIVGEGFTQPPGSAHAEIVALRAAGPRADGATLYVTLEPCCHQGRTGPCTEAIIKAGIREVHFAVVDPFPAVNGGGARILRDAEIRVTVGEGEAEARRLNQAFFHQIRTGRPFVTAKWAMTLDGKIATADGDSRWVSGEVARRRVHRERDASDAIVVGVGTVLADDPQLTVRISAKDDARTPRAERPWRVVLDSTARTPPDARVIGSDGRALIAVTDRASSDRIRTLEDAGASAVVLPTSDGKVDLEAALAALAERGVSRVLLESGGALLGGFFDRGLIDRVMAFVAPKLIGGSAALSPIAGNGRPLMAQALVLANVRVEVVGGDVLIEGIREE